MKVELELREVGGAWRLGFRRKVEGLGRGEKLLEVGRMGGSGW